MSGTSPTLYPLRAPFPMESTGNDWRPAIHALRKDLLDLADIINGTSSLVGPSANGSESANLAFAFMMGGDG